MQAVQYTEHRGRDVVTYGDAPDPSVGRDETLVDVKAGALNHLDVWTRRGLLWASTSTCHTSRGATPPGTFAVEKRATLPMSETARGHEMLEERDGPENVVVIPDSEYDA